MASVNVPINNDLFLKFKWAVWMAVGSSIEENLRHTVDLRMIGALELVVDPIVLAERTSSESDKCKPAQFYQFLSDICRLNQFLSDICRE
jgi:hypothetical protein